MASDGELIEVQVHYAPRAASDSRIHYQAELGKQLNVRNFELKQAKEDLYTAWAELDESRARCRSASKKAVEEEKMRKQLEEELATLRDSHKRKKKADSKKKKRLRAEVSKLRACLIGSWESRKALERQIESERRGGAGSSGTRAEVKEEIE